MKNKSIISVILIIFLFSICFNAVSAEEISEDHNLDESSSQNFNTPSDESLVEESDTIGLDKSADLNGENNFNNEDELKENTIKSKAILKSAEDNTLDIDYNQVHDESYNIVVDAIPSSNKLKIGETVKYTITVRNNNPFTVHYLEVFTPSGEMFWIFGKSDSKHNIGYLDETAWIIEKLGPGETITIFANIKAEEAGNASLELSLSHKFPPYEFKTYEKENKHKHYENNKNFKKERLNLENNADSINLAKNKTANPLFLLLISLCSLFGISLRNKIDWLIN